MDDRWLGTIPTAKLWGTGLVLLCAISGCVYGTPCRLSWDADRAKSAESLEYECADLDIEMTVSAHVSRAGPWNMQIVLEIENRSDTDVFLNWTENDAVCDNAISVTRETAFVDEKSIAGPAAIPSGRRRRVAVNYQINSTDSELLSCSVAKVKLGYLLQSGTGETLELPGVFVFPSGKSEGTGNS